MGRAEKETAGRNQEVMKNPLIVDNSMLSVFRQCPKKYFYRHIKGLNKAKVAAPLNFGAAIHAGIAEFLRGKPEEECMTTALAGMREQENREDEWRTPDRVIEVLDKYFKQPPITVVKSESGVPLIECEFALPLVEFPVDHAGFDGILYVGILDAIVEWGGKLYVCDHKTCSWHVRSPKGQEPYIDSNFWNQFKPHAATPGYIWGAQQFFKQPISGVMINGLGINKNHTTFGRHTFEWGQGEIDEWRADTIRTCYELMDCISGDYFRKNPDACNLYNSLCPFHDLCKLPATSRANLESLYIVDKWDPINARKKDNDEA